jgi:hypothetical protein
MGKNDSLLLYKIPLEFPFGKPICYLSTSGFGLKAAAKINAFYFYPAIFSYSRFLNIL